jgi:hypothetical protein
LARPAETFTGSGATTGVNSSLRVLTSCFMCWTVLVCGLCAAVLLVLANTLQFRPTDSTAGAVTG